MNDLFNQFASAFGKKEELSPADAFLAKKNKELEERQQAELDALEFPEETVSAMQPSKEFDEIPWIDEQQERLEEVRDINPDFSPAPPFMGLEYNNPNYDSMPQGLKEAQQRNGVRDHGLTGGFEKTDDNKVKFVEKPNGTVYVNDPNKITPQLKSVIDRKFPDADYVGTGDKVLYTGGIDPYKEDAIPSMAASILDNKITINPKTAIPINNDEQADLFEKESLIEDITLEELSEASDNEILSFKSRVVYSETVKEETPEEILDRFNKRGIIYPPQGVDKIYIAIDPGKSGGISAVDINGNVIFKKEMPLLNDELDAVGLYSILSEAMSNYNCVLVVEDVHSIFGVSASNNFVFGWVCGQIDAVVKLSKIKHEYIQPKFWQKNCWTNSDMIYKPLKEGQKRASVDTKATSLITAMRLFPREDLRGHVEIKYYGDTKENRKLNRAGEPIPTKKNKPHDGIVDSLLMAEVARRLNL